MSAVRQLMHTSAEPFLQLERPGNGVGHHSETDARNRGPRLPGIVISFENHFVILQLADKAERAAADGMEGEIAAAASGNNPNGAVRKVPQQGGIRLLQVDDHRRCIRCVDVIDMRQRLPPWR